MCRILFRQIVATCVSINVRLHHSISSGHPALELIYAFLDRSTTSSDSTCELPFVAPEPAASPSLSTHTSCESEASHKQSVVSQRVRRAYDLAKAGTTSPAKHSAPFVPKCNHCDDADVHTVVNELLKHLSPETLSDLSLEGKLGHIRTTQVELELALAHETSIKDKCVDRISRLSQTMSCQVVEHEEQLHEALTAKHAAEAQLQDLRLKFDDVGREVSHLQGEIKALKAGQNGMTDSEDDGRDSAVRNDRVMLHTLSARLEEAMIQAKDVITFKDGAIQSLEERLQLASKRGADAVTMLDEAKVRFEREKAELLAQLQHNKESCDSVNNAEVSRLQTQNAAIQQQKAELTVKVAQLTLELETARAQWAQEAEARERRAEERCAKQITHAEQQLEQATAAMQQQMAEFRAELDTKVARQRVAAQVACKAGQLRRQQLERELQRMKLKLAKQKAKLEKKARALVANAHKQHERPVAELQTELEELSVRFQTVLESEQDASRRARSSEETTHRLRAEMEQLQRSGGEVERERSALRNLCKELETNKAALKAEFDQRIHEMEQSLATQVKAAETRVHEERDGQMQTLIEQHEAQLNRLKTEAESTKSPATFARKKSPSSASSRSSEGSDGSRQKSIEELDALIDSKERRYRHLEGKREAPSLSPRPAKSSTLSLKRALAQRGKQIADLSAREKQLLVALATANEQETLAKRRNQEIEGRRRQELAQHEDLLQQLNSVKRENWSLSLALHVTEATNHQQQRGPVSSSPMY
jgi:chromosome segregation ATPase